MASPRIIAPLVVLILCDLTLQALSVNNLPQEETEAVDPDIIFTVPLITKDDRRDLHRVRRSENNSKHIQITLPTPRDDIVLRLLSSNSLLVPGATYEVRRGNISTATPVRNDCYFQGKVVDKTNSFAALSICNGLIGIYEFDGKQYSIEPSEANDSVDVDNSQRLHTIKRVKKTGLTGYEGLLDSEFKLSEVGELSSGRRERRAAVIEKHLEVMVVIDRTVIDFHGEQNTELFVLALFNMVNMIYGHSSLGVHVKLSLVKLVLLEDDTAAEMWKGDSPRVTLDRFCMWSAVNSLREHEVGHYDFAMYLSRGRMAPAGYAPVTGMCRPDRSCALIKEDGFSTSFVAAHEIGHTIGMSHDGEGTNKCVNEPKRGSIMAPLVMANLNSYFWSPCSKEEIDSIVSTLYCMNDDPFDLKWPELEMPLGKNWDLDEQCEKEFGSGFQLCSRVTHNFNPCEHLWCSTPGNRYLCKTKRAPPLPGSTCAQDRWCFNSHCVVANPDDPLWKDKRVDHGRLKSVDGSWSRWTSWSECSTSCGRGIKSRTRTCNEPEPALGGKDCRGEGYDLRLCNLPSCKTAINDVRLDQCTKYNKRRRTYHPFEPEEESKLCLLNCRTREADIPLYGEIEAMDGSFCSYDDRNAMCYAGNCIPVGCDGKLNSGAREDMCGQCKGDNTQCTLRQDYYNERLDRGYQLLVRLYPGTRNFRIKKPADAYRLVLKNVKTNQTVLSERIRQTVSVVDYGSLWKYSNNRSETLECSGPLQAEYDVIIYALYSGMRATLSVTFTEPLSISRKIDGAESSVSIPKSRQSGGRGRQKKKYMYGAAGWGECSKPCGDGIQEQQLACKNTKLNLTVHELLCKSEKKPNTFKKTCNIKPCDIRYRWIANEWTKCPANVCSLEQVSQKRWTFCVREGTALHVRWQRVKDTHCSNIKKPVLSKLCDKSACSKPGYWKTGQFSQCSVTCGVGVQERNVTCLPFDSAYSGRTECDNDSRPSGSEACMNRPCRQYKTTVAARTSNPSTGTTAHATTSTLPHTPPGHFSKQFPNKSVKLPSSQKNDKNTFLKDFSISKNDYATISPQSTSTSPTISLTTYHHRFTIDKAKATTSKLNVATTGNDKLDAVWSRKLKATSKPSTAANSDFSLLTGHSTTIKFTTTTARTLKNMITTTATMPTTTMQRKSSRDTINTYPTTRTTAILFSLPHQLTATTNTYSTSQIAINGEGAAVTHSPHLEKTGSLSSRGSNEKDFTDDSGTTIEPISSPKTTREVESIAIGKETIATATSPPTPSSPTKGRMTPSTLSSIEHKLKTDSNNATHEEKTTTKLEGKTTPFFNANNLPLYPPTSAIPVNTKSMRRWTTTIAAQQSLTKFVRQWTTPSALTTFSSKAKKTGKSPDNGNALPQNKLIASQPTKVDFYPRETTTFSNVLLHNIRKNKSPVQGCKSDLASICELMNTSKCRLLLFKRLCCYTCIQFQ